MHNITRNSDTSSDLASFHVNFNETSRYLPSIFNVSLIKMFPQIFQMRDPQEWNK